MNKPEVLAIKRRFPLWSFREIKRLIKTGQIGFRKLEYRGIPIVKDQLALSGDIRV